MKNGHKIKTQIVELSHVPILNIFWYILVCLINNVVVTSTRNVLYNLQLEVSKKQTLSAQINSGFAF